MACFNFKYSWLVFLLFLSRVLTFTSVTTVTFKWWPIFLSFVNPLCYYSCLCFCFYSWKLPLSGLPGGFCTYPGINLHGPSECSQLIWSRRSRTGTVTAGKIGRVMTTVTYSDQTKQKAMFCSHCFRTSNARINVFAKSIAGFVF